MKELIDLFAKLLIGTFTFIGPSFTLFISIFYRHSERMRQTHIEAKNTLLRLEEHNGALIREIRKYEKSQRLLNPKLQVIRIYFALLVSIALVGFYYFQQSPFWKYPYAWMIIVTLVVSILLFIYCLVSLYQIFSTVIDARYAEEEEKKRKNVQIEALK
jgi:magnesium-transporting ATPase (P-type)